MRRGCVSLGETQCDDCHCAIPYPDRYLVIDEEDSVEVGKGKTLRYCVDCCLKNGYAHYKIEKGQRILTFFSE